MFGFLLIMSMPLVIIAFAVWREIRPDSLTTAKKEMEEEEKKRESALEETRLS